MGLQELAKGRQICCLLVTLASQQRNRPQPHVDISAGVIGLVAPASGIAESVLRLFCQEVSARADRDGRPMTPALMSTCGCNLL